MNSNFVGESYNGFRKESWLARHLASRLRALQTTTVRRSCRELGSLRWHRRSARHGFLLCDRISRGYRDRKHTQSYSVFSQYRFLPGNR